MDTFANPAIWALVALIAWPVSLIVGTLITRRHLRELNEFAEQIDGHPEANSADRVWLTHMLEEATDWRPVALTVLLAPIFPVLAIFAGIDMMRDDPDPEVQFKVTKERIDALELILAQETGQERPDNGNFWNDPRRDDMRSATFEVNFLKNPILLVWIAIWGLPSVLILLLTGSLKPTAHFFRDQVQPLVHRWLAALAIIRGNTAYR